MKLNWMASGVKGEEKKTNNSLLNFAICLPKDSQTFTLLKTVVTVIVTVTVTVTVPPQACIEVILPPFHPEKSCFSTMNTNL